MAIITISRGSYSRGKDVAEMLARKLGYACLSRDILLEASDEFDIPEIKLVRALHDAPTVLERFSHGKERYVNYIRSALLLHVLKDNVVYHGLAGHYLLSDIPNVLKVRIIADMEDRVREEMKRENISAEKARYILKKDDEERRKWSLQLYGTDTWDSRLYDMVLNIKNLTVDDAVDILAETAQKPIFQTTSESKQILENLALAARVQMKLTKLDPTISVSAENGMVNIANINRTSADNSAALAEIKRLAESVPGVKEVVLQHFPTQKQEKNINPFHNVG
ncbi:MULTISPECIES: AAA family ATPase [Desulfococcus]|jgi:cytidylate kinase|uniref:Cytidylate kinase-like family n=1 Tax=Desulfococcus multivorans DSM 2059 TaxID=1121405 RepID=S7TQA3_DESML|nr:cytidylate kinase-like family protein [Desulfococcus multivorans]AOY57742.1 Cmk: cytidylate kinase [Desulfococcus multivorans]AQV00132.1 histidine kinase [Desulfococcus multivorans]EPR38825.1 Cytidylate kinase-like family [Desulfococcus multivorans DSM 2059]MDX9818865.1 cytidylate kinase-like family protein [Desulfococcus multivorans]SJZ80448.1 Cytidylate kinase [Desulfococcus multivorans DSM 2059]